MTVQPLKALVWKAASEAIFEFLDAPGSTPLHQKVHAMWANPFRRAKRSEDLRPWEARALEQARAGQYTAYVELHFSYLVLNDPRSDLLLRKFRTIIQDREASQRFLAYCLHHQSGGVIGSLKG
jgi:hypothetical protein